MNRPSTTTRRISALMWCALLSSLLLLGAGCQSSFERLEKQLRSKDARERETAAYMLKRHGKRGVPLLNKALTQDSDQRVRRAAALTLGRLGYTEGIPALRKGMWDKAWNVRRECVRSLGLIGARAVVAAKDLLYAWGDDRWEVRGDVPDTWKALKLPTDKAVPLLIEGLKLPRWRSQVVAASELGKLGAQAQTAEPHLVAALSNKHHRVRGAAASALGRVGKAPDTALLRALSDAHPKVRALSAKALGRRQMVSPAVLRGLAKALGDAVSAVRYSVGVALVRIGEPAVPLLVELIGQPLWKSRGEALRILGSMGPRARTAVPTLVAILKSPQKDYAKNLACETLRKIGPAAAAAVPALMETFLGNASNSDGNLFRASARALGHMGHAAISPLVRTLNHERASVRIRASMALGLNGPVAKPAVGALVTALTKDKHHWVREHAAQALGRIGVSGSAVKSALQRALGDTHNEVKKAAQKSLAQLAKPAKTAKTAQP